MSKLFGNLLGYGEDSYKKKLAELDIPEIPDFNIQYNVEGIISEDVEKILAEKIAVFSKTQNKFTKDGEEFLKKVGQLTINQLNQRLMLDNERDKQSRALKKAKARLEELTTEERTEDFRKSYIKKKRAYKNQNRRERLVKKYTSKISILEGDIDKLEKDQSVVDAYLGKKTRIKSMLGYSVIYGSIMAAITIAETIVISTSLSNSDIDSNSGFGVTVAITGILTMGQAIFAHFSGITSIKLGKFAPEFKLTFGAGIFLSLLVCFLRYESGSPIGIAIFSLFAYLLEVYISRLRYVNQNFVKKIYRKSMRLVNLKNRIVLKSDNSEIDKIAQDKTMEFEHILNDQMASLEGRVNAIDRVKQQIKDAVSIEVFKGISQLKSI